jgi:hypothetical protein
MANTWQTVSIANIIASKTIQAIVWDYTDLYWYFYTQDSYIYRALDGLTWSYFSKGTSGILGNSGASNSAYTLTIGKDLYGRRLIIAGSAGGGNLTYSYNHTEWQWMTKFTSYIANGRTTQLTNANSVNGNTSSGANTNNRVYYVGSLWIVNAYNLLNTTYSNYCIAYSHDGFNWTPSANSTNAFKNGASTYTVGANDLMLATDGNVIVAGFFNTYYMAYSFDGMKWFPVKVEPIFTESIQSIIYTGDSFVVATNGSQSWIYTSTDGISYTGTKIDAIQTAATSTTTYYTQINGACSMYVGGTFERRGSPRGPTGPLGGRSPTGPTGPFTGATGVTGQTGFGNMLLYTTATSSGTHIPWSVERIGASYPTGTTTYDASQNPTVITSPILYPTCIYFTPVPIDITSPTAIISILVNLSFYSPRLTSNDISSIYSAEPQTSMTQSFTLGISSVPPTATTGLYPTATNLTNITNLANNKKLNDASKPFIYTDLSTCLACIDTGPGTIKYSGTVQGSSRSFTSMLSPGVGSWYISAWVSVNGFSGYTMTPPGGGQNFYTTNTSVTYNAAGGLTQGFPSINFQIMNIQS